MKLDIKKVAHAIFFFQQQGVQHLAKTKLMKLMFYADKYHLQVYMRPVFQDVYFKLPHGPVPTLTLNVINSVNVAENDDLQELVDAFLSVVSVEENTQRNIAQRSFLRMVWCLILDCLAVPSCKS